MVCITIGSKPFCPYPSLWPVFQLQVSSAFQIAEDMLYCFPVCHSWIGVETSQHSNSISNIRTGHYSQIHEGSDCIDVRDFLHLYVLLWSVWTLCDRQFKTRKYGSTNWLAISHSKFLQLVNNILFLRQP